MLAVLEVLLRHANSITSSSEGGAGDGWKLEGVEMIDKGET